MNAKKENIIEQLEKEQTNKKTPNFSAGDTVKVNVKVIEENRTRIQAFEGVVIAKKGTLNRQTFTVKKVSFGTAVERTFPIHSPSVDSIKVISKGDVRRAKLYYLRNLRGKKARIKEKM